MTEAFLFDRETAVEQITDNHWRGHIAPCWNIGTNPNGGYLLSVVVRALSAALPHPDPLSITTHYLRPGVAGEDCEIHIDLVRAGRTLSTARASLSQQGRERLEVLASFGDLSTSAGVDTELTLPMPDLPEPDACVQRSGDSQGVDLPILQRLDTRLHPQQVLAGQAGKAEVSGWIRFRDGREPDSCSLPLFTDTFPPSPFGLLGVVGWVPTIELTVHVRRRPAPGWIAARFQTEDLQLGRMLESGALWDSQGNLVAQCRQLGLVTARS
jgi:acyl-CoA thioesterase